MAKVEKAMAGPPYLKSDATHVGNDCWQKSSTSAASWKGSPSPKGSPQSGSNYKGASKGASKGFKGKGKGKTAKGKSKGKMKGKQH